MKKIISLFKRDYEGNHQVYDEVVPGAEWVLAGEGTATQKHDGTCCLIKEGALFKRYTLKKGKTAPEYFCAATEVDERTGKQEGWVLCNRNDPSDKYHFEAFKDQADGTYELCGPKIQGNPEDLDRHILLPHGVITLAGVPNTFEGIREYLTGKDYEGIVWHHPDGRMVKIKKKDFGLKRKDNIYKNKVLNWNGNELVFQDQPDVGVAGIAPGQDDSLGEEMAYRWTVYSELKKELAKIKHEKDIQREKHHDSN
jgi:hypothetical protein